MIFIIGGSYQGKCDFAKVKFGLKDSDLFGCEGDSVDLSARAIAHIERFALSCVQKGEEPKAFWAAHRADLEDKILIADDSKMNQQILSEILGGRYEYLYADDGMQALELLLLDINMPRLDGFGVLEVMKQRN